MIDLEGHDQYERLILTTRHGLALVKALRLDVSDEASDVVDLAAAAAKKPRARKAPGRPRPRPDPDQVTSRRQLVKCPMIRSTSA